MTLDTLTIPGYYQSSEDSPSSHSFRRANLDKKYPEINSFSPHGMYIEFLLSKDGERWETKSEGFSERNLRRGILDIKLPIRFTEQGIMQPTMRCRKIASDLAVTLLRRHDMHPDRFEASVEEGVGLIYKNYAANKVLVIEIYNTTEIAAIINKDKQILGAWDIVNESDEVLTGVIRVFKEN